MCVYGCVSIANFVKYLKTRNWHYWDNVRLRTLVFLFPASTWGDCSFFLSLHFYFLLFVFVCLSVHLLVCVCVYVCVCVCLSVCLSVSLPVSRSVYLCVSLSMCLCDCMSVCASVCLYVIMYYVYMYVDFIVINVCKLLHVRRPTSSPRAVWNPCKINKALN